MRCRRRRIVRRQRNVYMLLGGSAETNKCEKKRRQSQSRLHFLTKLRSLPSSRMKYHLFRKCKSVKTRLRIKWKGAFFHPPIFHPSTSSTVISPLIGNFPAKRKLGPGNDISGLRHAPFGEATMDTAPAKQAAKKCSPEKRLPASRTFPVCQPCGHEEVSYKSQRKEKPRNKMRESYLQHCREKETKHHNPAPPVRAPGIRILRIDPKTAGFV